MQKTAPRELTEHDLLNIVRAGADGRRRDAAKRWGTPAATDTDTGLRRTASPAGFPHGSRLISALALVLGALTAGCGDTAGGEADTGGVTTTDTDDDTGGGDAGDAAATVDAPPHDPGDPACQGAGGEGTEPWARTLVEWRSADGTEFTQHRTFQVCADVPSLAADDSGTLIAAFQGFEDRSEDARWDKIAVRISSDQGENWSALTFIELAGFPEGSVRPFDPTITFDAAAQRWRLYVSMSLGSSPVLDDTFCTHSAVSDDGITYTYEDGPRFCTDGGPVIDPALGWLDGLWYYSAPRGAPQEGAFFASSPDGLTFTEQAPIPSDKNHRWTGNFIAVDGALRFYGAEALFPAGNLLWWAETRDGGVTWSDYTRTNVSAGKDPAVIRLDGGTFVLLVPTRTP